MAANRATMDVPPEVNDGIAVVVKKAGFSNPRIHIESGSNVGDGYTSVIYRVIIVDEGKTSSDDLRLICKTTVSETGNIMQFLFVAEAIVYNTLVPDLEDVAQLKHPLPWPKCYYATTASARPCLVMGDKCLEHFRMADRRVSLDEHHLRHALFQLGRFHGATMAMQLLRPAEFDAIAKKITEPYRTEDVRNMWKSFMVAAEETPGMLLERYPRGSKAHTKIEQFFSTFCEKYFNEIWTPGKGVGNSIIHGDCHVNNMLFQYDEAGAVTGCCLIDFQTARFSTTALDVAMLFLSGTEQAMRAVHRDDLLRHYHTVLRNTMREAGVQDPDAVYSWEQFMTRLGDVAGYGLFMAPLLAQAMEADAEKAKEIQGSVAVLLNECDSSETAFAEAAAGFKLTWSPEMQRRVGDLVDDLIHWGWL